MATTRRSTDRDEVFDQFRDALARERDATDASLQATRILCRNIGASQLVGLEDGGERVVFHWTDDEEFVAAIPFDETGVKGDSAEILARGEDARGALDDVEYAWVHPEYRELR